MAAPPLFAMEICALIRENERLPWTTHYLEEQSRAAAVPINGQEIAQTTRLHEDNQDEGDDGKPAAEAAAVAGRGDLRSCFVSQRVSNKSRRFFIYE